LLDLDSDDEEFENPKSDEPKQPLTPQELEEKKRQLQEKIHQIRLQKAEEEKQRDIERELTRRKSGQEAIDAKKKWEDNAREREALAKKKEKDEEKKARLAVKQQLEQDKAERRARQQAAASASTSTTSTAALIEPAKTAAVAEPAAKKEYTECALQFRFSDGNVIKASFKPTDTLRTAWSHISLLTNNSNFALMTNFPKKIFSPRDDSLDRTSLAQAELVPTGTLIITKIP